MVVSQVSDLPEVMLLKILSIDYEQEQQFHLKLIAYFCS